MALFFFFSHNDAGLTRWILDDGDHDALPGGGVEHREVAAATGRVGRQRRRHRRPRTVYVGGRAEALVRVPRAQAREPGDRLHVSEK